MKMKYIIAVIFTILILLLVFDYDRDDKEYQIAIATLMSHPALDSLQMNLISELEHLGYGDKISYTIENASGQIQLTSSIANKLAGKQFDAIVAITTPMAQAIKNVIDDPIIFAAVTDPVGAGLVKKLDEGEHYITGTSDAWPYEDQLRLIRAISPSISRLGVLYNPGEAASQYGIKEIRRLAPKYGFSIIEGGVLSTVEVYPVAQNIANRSEALFLSSDNTVIAGVSAALKVAIEYQIPLYVGDSGTVEKGGVAAVSVGYSQLGIETARLVERVINGEDFIPTYVATGSDIYLNIESAHLTNTIIPSKIIDSATKVYETINQ